MHEVALGVNDVVTWSTGVADLVDIASTEEGEKGKIGGFVAVEEGSEIIPWMQGRARWFQCPRPDEILDRKAHVIQGLLSRNV